MPMLELIFPPVQSGLGVPGPPSSLDTACSHRPRCSSPRCVLSRQMGSDELMLLSGGGGVRERRGMVGTSMAMGLEGGGVRALPRLDRLGSMVRPRSSCSLLGTWCAGGFCRASGFQGLHREGGQVKGGAAK